MGYLNPPNEAVANYHFLGVVFGFLCPFLLLPEAQAFLQEGVQALVC